jgi:hypothetical protein
VVNFGFLGLNKLISGLFINLLSATPQPAKKYIKGRKTIKN